MRPAPCTWPAPTRASPASSACAWRRNGPGVANALPGIAVEQAEGNRVLVVTACRRPGIAYPDRGGSYQCFDQSGVIGKMAKWSCVIHSFERIPELVRMALRKSWEGRPGVVHIDVPENIMNTKVKAEPAFWAPHQYRRTAAIVPSPELVARAADMLIAAEQPLIHAGSGVIHCAAYAELRRVAELLCAPVTTSWSARGVLPETSELALPMIHVKLNHTARNDADLVLALGTRFGETDWWGKAPYWSHPSQQKMIQVDADGEMLGMNKPADLAILADAKLFLAALAERLEARIRRNSHRCAQEKYRALQRDHAARPPRMGPGARGPLRADEPGACRQRVPRILRRRRDPGGRWRQHHHLGEFLSPGARAEYAVVDIQVRHARRGRGAGAGSGGGVA